jgi:hypothetical protein
MFNYKTRKKIAISLMQYASASDSDYLSILSKATDLPVDFLHLYTKAYK